MSAVTSPQVGSNYRLVHSRFGQATVRVDGVNGAFAGLTILQGVLRGMTETWGAGEHKTVRLSHSEFYELN